MIIPQRILVAPSGFKGSLDADDVATAIANGIRRVIPGVSVVSVPVPDGGEGTARMLTQTTGGILHRVTFTGPTGSPIPSSYGLLGEEQDGVAIVEMAAAAGLSLVPENLRNPAETTTYGVGELIKEALAHDNVHTILVGCGDSGTCDGGMGALAALGAKILDENGDEIPPVGSQLHRVHRIDLNNINPRLNDVKLVLALNQHNVLTGTKGVARVFGPQKGATETQIDMLDAGLSHWAKILSETEKTFAPSRATDYHLGAGTGASGGLGAGLALLGAHLTPRFEALIDSGLSGLKLNEEISRADLIITAEGAIDFQTPRGKVPAEIAARAQNDGIPVLALAGTIGDKAYRVHETGIGAIASIIPLPMDLDDALARGAELLTDSAERCFRILLLGSAMNSRITNKQKEQQANTMAL